MKLIIDSFSDSYVDARVALAALYPNEMQRLEVEQRTDLPALRTRVDTETAGNAAAAAAFGLHREDGGAPPVPPAPVPPVVPVAPVAPVPPVPVAPVPPVPVAPVPPIQSNMAGPPAGVALDTEGLPWDARIHAATKTKVANGAWKKKKGVDASILAGVTAELRAVMGLPAPAPVTLTPGVPSTPAALAQAAPIPPAPAWPLNGSPPPAPVPPVAAAPIPPAPPAAPATIGSFAQLMGYISSQIAAGKWSHPETLTACQAQGITALPLLASRPDLIPGVAATIAAMIQAKG